jgi:hypothetical protein
VVAAVGAAIDGSGELVFPQPAMVSTPVITIAVHRDFIVIDLVPRALSCEPDDPQRGVVPAGHP